MATSMRPREGEAQLEPDGEGTGLSAANRAWIEGLYARWLEDRAAVPEKWGAFFERLEDDQVGLQEVLPPPPIQRSIFAGARAAEPSDAATRHVLKSAAVLHLVDAYRRNGHLAADLDPLGLRERPWPRELTLEYWGLSEADLDTSFATGRLSGPDQAPLRDIVARCRRIYCGSLGSEFMYIRDEERRRWVERYVEESEARIELDRPTALRFLDKLTAAHHFESFIHTKYLGAKRFSLEGLDALIPMLDLMLTAASGRGVAEVVIGMAHRGRLNVLANILGKASQDIFEEFEDQFPRPAQMGGGDVKYHLGYASDLTTPAGRKIHVRVAFNPSHLEYVNPVVEGMVRGKQEHFKDVGRERSLPILMHGDAAFMGQGVVAETLNLAGLPGYTTGGTIHIVTNNQVGFTTPPGASRSSEHPTDIVKMTLPPIFHVNSDDLGAVALVARLAVEYRQTFGQDVVVDLIGYRRYGHNEGDEPAFTQPRMYQAMQGKPSPLQCYVDRYRSAGVITAEDVEAADARVRGQLEQALRKARSKDRQPGQLAGLWKGLKSSGDPAAADYPTRVDVSVLREVARELSQVPDGFEVHPKIRRILKYRAEVAGGAQPADWAMGEALAYGTLLREGHPVRLSGQDSGRGTFSHRHAVLHDQKTGQRWVGLDHLGRTQARFEVIDSPLSEAAVLGFEYGYTLSRPEALVVWEAQFGDFANGAQVIIDQFIGSSEAKWNRHTGVVLLLPHGYEGQGPEHSSARLERFLQLSAEDNWRVIYPTTPGQLFHALRGQLHRNYRKPLVVMTPKSLLRHPGSFSPLEEMAQGGFRPVIAPVGADAGAVRRVVLCSGKVYYELAAHLENHPAPIALVRVEQLYPFPGDLVLEALGRHRNAEDVVWCQEEPANMGAWPFVFPLLLDLLGKRPRYAGRPPSASPATGSKFLHDQEQAALIRQATELAG